MLFNEPDPTPSAALERFTNELKVAVKRAQASLTVEDWNRKEHYRTSRAVLTATTDCGLDLKAPSPERLAEARHWFQAGFTVLEPSIERREYSRFYGGFEYSCASLEQSEGIPLPEQGQTLLTIEPSYGMRTEEAFTEFRVHPREMELCGLHGPFLDVVMQVTGYYSFGANLVSLQINSCMFGHQI